MSRFFCVKVWKASFKFLVRFFQTKDEPQVVFVREISKFSLLIDFTCFQIFRAYRAVGEENMESNHPICSKEKFLFSFTSCPLWIIRLNSRELWEQKFKRSLSKNLLFSILWTLVLVFPHQSYSQLQKPLRRVTLNTRTLNPLQAVNARLKSNEFTYHYLLLTN